MKRLYSHHAAILPCLCIFLLSASALQSCSGKADEKKPAPICTAPEEELVDTSDSVFSKVEVEPQFPGGRVKMLEYIRKNQRLPEPEGLICSIGPSYGIVVVLFTVNKDGSLADIEIIKHFDPILDKEAVRIIKSMPKCIPGRQNGKIVRARYTVPVMFNLL